MSMFGGNGLPGSYNEDVLSAEPGTIEEKDRLVAEIKNRAKGCISSRNYPEAVKLYAKAIENTDHDCSASAILYANRSMCYLNIGNAADALTDAKKAQQLDINYVKSYYREAMALRAQQQFNRARSALQKGLELKPDDKEMKAQLLKTEEDIAKQKPPSTTTSPATTKHATKKGPSVPAAAPSNPKSSSSSVAMNTEDDDDDDADIQNLNLRGYKKTSDGRTTTFFNNELDEKSKQLIGDIAPKKIEKGVVDSGIASNNAGSGSVWNSAGTYEERILTPWASNRLSGLMSKISCSLTERDIDDANFSGASIKVTKVDEVTGDAQVSMVRGKKKYICDFSLSVHWCMQILKRDGSDPEIVEGKIALMDITSDKEFEVGDVEVLKLKGNSCSAAALPKEIGRLYNAYIKGSSKGLQLAVKKEIDIFCEEFKTK